jgi:hypothetical protein
MVIRWEESPLIRFGKVIGVYLLWFLKDLKDGVIAVLKISLGNQKTTSSNSIPVKNCLAVSGRLLKTTTGTPLLSSQTS